MDDHTDRGDAAVALACSLRAGQLADRTVAWREVVARGLRRSEGPGRVTSVYPNERDLIERLTQLIDAESECCPFLRFTLQETDDGVQVTLEYPEAFAEYLGSVLPSRQVLFG